MLRLYVSGWVCDCVFGFVVVLLLVTCCDGVFVVVCCFLLLDVKSSSPHLQVVNKLAISGECFLLQVNGEAKHNNQTKQAAKSKQNKQTKPS